MDITLQRILDLLSEKGKAQKELTDFIGISSNSFTNWKSGRNVSYKKYIYAIAEFLGVSVDYLLGNSNLKTENEKTITDDDIKFALFGGDGEITDEMYDDVKKFAQFIKEKYENDKKE